MRSLGCPAGRLRQVTGGKHLPGRDRESGFPPVTAASDPWRGFPCVVTAHCNGWPTLSSVSGSSGRGLPPVRFPGASSNATQPTGRSAATSAARPPQETAASGAAFPPSGRGGWPGGGPAPGQLTSGRAACRRPVRGATAHGGLRAVRRRHRGAAAASAGPAGPRACVRCRGPGLSGTRPSPSSSPGPPKAPVRPGGSAGRIRGCPLLSSHRPPQAEGAFPGR